MTGERVQMADYQEILEAAPFVAKEVLSIFLACSAVLRPSLLPSYLTRGPHRVTSHVWAEVFGFKQTFRSDQSIVPRGLSWPWNRLASEQGGPTHILPRHSPLTHHPQMHLDLYEWKIARYQTDGKELDADACYALAPKNKTRCAQTTQDLCSPRGASPKRN